MVEYKDATPEERAVNLCNSGMMAARAEDLFPLLARVGNDNAAGEYYLPDIVMLAAAGCFRKPLIIDPEITNDRFVLWISANDPRFSTDGVVDFMRGLNPMEIRTLKKDADK